MNTLEFLQRVLPSEGYYVTTVINTDGRRQGFFKTVDELATVCERLDKTDNNTYFAISAYKQKGNRRQDNVRATKVVAIDVDCGEGKPFPSWKEGLVELGKFVSDMGLPKPMVIHSGNGLHVYWVLKEELAPEDWKPLAEAMKQAAIAKEFHIDAGLTANSALVLRPVGTRNPKNGNTVKLLVDAEPVKSSALTQSLSYYFRAAPAAAEGHTRENSLLQNLAVKQDFPPAVGSVVASKCKQIEWAINHQDEVDEPLWYDLIGVAAFCTDPDKTALEWSKGHPKFDEHATLQKLTHWKESASGPATCAKFEIDRPNGCRGCKYKGKIGSPARLGVQYQEIDVPTEAPDKVANTVPIPKPFKRTKDGIKVTIDDTDVDVCKFDIYPVGYGMDESLGYETVRYHWNRPHMGWQELVLRQAYLTDGNREFATAIADQGIVLYNKRQTEYFQLMLRTYMDELRQIRKMTNLYSTMGWKEKNTAFVLGNTLIRKDDKGVATEEQINLASVVNRQGSELYNPKGDIEQWTALTNVLEKGGLYAHMFVLGVGFSAPLYNFTGLKGLTVSLYGPTGGGKTLAQYWAQSIYGNPDKLHFAAKYTQNSLFTRLGTYANLPLTIDEVTMMNDKEVGDFCYWVSQGRDKARLNRNAEERDAKTWSTPVIVSTNKSLQSKLIASGLDTDAQMARLLELTVPPAAMFTRNSEIGRKIYEAIHTNYGYVGRSYIKRLLEMGEEGIQASIAEASNSFRKRYKAKFSGEERYWEQSIILADLAMQFANDWGMIKFDHCKATEWVLSQIGAIRRTVQENQVDSFDLLAEYMADCADAQVTVMHTVGQKPQPDFGRMPRSDIRVRLDVFRKSAADPFDKGTMMVDRTHFRKWLSVRGADYKTFKQELTEESALATPKSEKASLGKDTPTKLAQTYVIGFNLTHPRFQSLLENADVAADDLAYGQLQVVKNDT
tara:strand:+ start:283 stop:3138 length:2856 start_codon:yes stop_codon:yes gene_type:complete